MVKNTSDTVQRYSLGSDSGNSHKLLVGASNCGVPLESGNVTIS